MSVVRVLLWFHCCGECQLQGGVLGMGLHSCKEVFLVFVCHGGSLGVD